MRQAGLVVDAWTVTSGDGRRWLVTCGTGERGETYVNATLKLGVGHRYLAQDLAARMLDVARTFASQLVIKGATLHDVQELFGHTTMTMTLRYA